MKKSSRGFTLIQLLVVIAIIAILSSMMLGGVLAVRKAAKRNQTQLILAKVDAAIRQFRADNRVFPRGMATKYPLAFQDAFSAATVVAANFFDIQIAAATGLPVPANDADWKNGTTPWMIGNGLYARLGVALTSAEKLQAVTNANLLRQIENERFYHIGNFGDRSAGVYWGGSWMSGSRPNWVFYDDFGVGLTYDLTKATLGEKELKKVEAHYRHCSYWTGGYAGDGIDSGVNFCTQRFFANHMNYLSYVRPRDCKDAYQRALRNGVPVESFTFDSAFDSSHQAQSDGALISRTISISTASKPWSENYLVDLETRYHRDVDGDGNQDILDAYGHPLIYINEGTPADDRIFPRQAAVGYPMPSTTESIDNGYQMDMGIVHYHPDPDLDWAGYFGIPSQWATDKPNSRGVPVTADAYDTSCLITMAYSWSGGNYAYGSPWIFEYYGYDPFYCADPYTLAGTLVPSRMRINSVPSANRGGDIYYCWSKQNDPSATVGEPYNDKNNNGQYDAGEWPYGPGGNGFIDRNGNGVYDSNIAANDIRLCAPSGLEREYELWSAGRDGFFHAVRNNAVNNDNIGSQAKK